MCSQGQREGFVRRNFVLNIFDGALFAFGLSFASRATVLPVFVKRIGGDNIAVGLIPVLWFIGFNLPQLFIADYAERVSPKKPLLLRTALLQRLPWLLLAALTYVVIEAVSTEVGLLLFFVGFGLAAVGGSVNLPVWFDLIAKITPVRYDAFLRRLPVILRQERNFRNFLVGQVLLVTATLTEAFYAVDALERFSLSEGYAGHFIVVMMASMMVGSLLFGYLADRFGHRMNLVLAGVSMAAACLVALTAPTVEVYYLAFVGIACTLGPDVVPTSVSCTGPADLCGACQRDHGALPAARPGSRLDRQPLRLRRRLRSGRCAGSCGRALAGLHGQRAAYR